MRQISKIYAKIKRCIDIVTSFSGVVIISPLLIIIAFLIKSSSMGPVFFKQERIGLSGKPFFILKFRTMVVNAEKLGRQITVQGDPRITKVGNLLRKFKLDELPQLFNVLKGDMSLVGPRPEVKRYVELYSAQQRQVLSVRPGITDYASIEFRNENDILAISTNPEKTYINKIMPEKLKMNLRYIDEMSFKIDVKIILLTIFKVFIHRRNSWL